MSVVLLKGLGLNEVKEVLGRFLSEGINSKAVRQLAERAIAGQDDHVVAIFNFIKATFPYVPDPYGIELFRHPNLIAEQYFEGNILSEDCDGLALLAGSMLGSIGHEVRLALLDTNRDGELDHAIAQVVTDKLGWLNVDCASQNPLGWHIEAEGIEYITPAGGS